MTRNTINNGSIRYNKYLIAYTDIIHEYSDELKTIGKKRPSGEVKIGKRKHNYFSTLNGVTLIDKKNECEISFIFNNDITCIYFDKGKFHNYIESDLNANGLGLDFPSNKTMRSEIFEVYFDSLIKNKTISVLGELYTLSNNK